jgi:hypothetical protein
VTCRISGIVLPEGSVGGISGGHQVTLESLADIVASLSLLPLHSHGRFHGFRIDGFQHLFPNGGIHRQSTEGDAAGFATVHPAAVAGIAQDVMIVPGIADGQFTATPSAAQNTGEQGIPALGRATGFTALPVVLDHRPDRLGSLPIDITLVRAGIQRQPVLSRFTPGTAPWGRSVVKRHGSRLAIGISTTINRVRQDPVERSITGALPGYIATRSPGREIEAVLEEPQQGLTDAAEFDEL